MKRETKVLIDRIINICLGVCIVYIFWGFDFNFSDFNTQEIIGVVLIPIVYLRMLYGVFIKKELIFTQKMGLPKTEYKEIGPEHAWFYDYDSKQQEDLSSYFGLRKENEKEIIGIVGPTYKYTNKDGEEVFALSVDYKDEANAKEYHFYCPGFEYDPSKEYPQGMEQEVVVDMFDYSKYDIKVY